MHQRAFAGSRDTGDDDQHAERDVNVDIAEVVRRRAADLPRTPLLADGLFECGPVIEVAAGLARGRRWSRTPAMLTQLFFGIVGIYLVQGDRYDWGVPCLVLAVAGFAAVLAPPSLRALAGDRRPG